MRMSSWWSRDGKSRESPKEKAVAKKGVSKEEKLFIKNGSCLLEEQIRFCNLKYNPIRIFSKEELRRATNNYSQLQIFHMEGPYDLYKGTFEERNISVKKFKKNIICFEDNINEIVIASQMSSHKNVLRLLGCCLETNFPILVYEFAGKGPLKDYILENEEQSSSRLSWEKKLRIATEIADVVTYMHIAKSRPIIHRGLKSYNIFMDDNYVAKLPGFTFSVPIPLGKTHVEGGKIMGTFGYVDPDTEISGRFTVKSDVYGFGAVLLEILTGKLVVEILNEELNFDHSGLLGNRDIRSRYGVIERYLKASVMKEGNMEQLVACGELALRCLKENPEERPTMKEVAQELRQIRKLQPFPLPCSSNSQQQVDSSIFLI